MTPADPLPAATVILCRPIQGSFEVLLVKRPLASRFMPGMSVFPGGRVDDTDGAGDAGFRNAAVREAAEECGIVVQARALFPWSWWITPEAEPRRYDTRFFLAEVPLSSGVHFDGHEIVDAFWSTPRAALAAYRAGEIFLAPPTFATLEDLLPFSSVAAAAAAVVLPLRPVLPVLDRRGDDIVLALPGDALHPEAVRCFQRRTRIVGKGGSPARMLTSEG